MRCVVVDVVVDVRDMASDDNDDDDDEVGTVFVVTRDDDDDDDDDDVEPDFTEVRISVLKAMH